VEHPFGTIKAWMGSTHFLMKTLEKVKTEMSLHVLAYNLKRMINILGVGPLLRALAAQPSHDGRRPPTLHTQTTRHRVFTRPRSKIHLLTSE
jgi:hypothetical protein